MGNPFLDPATLDTLYTDPTRLTLRTSALHQAKIKGAEVAETVVGLLRDRAGADAVIADIGCGRGSTTLSIARHLPVRKVIAFDASPALLGAARERFATARLSAQFIVGDFHRLPFGDSSLDAIVAAFCLYHSTDPGLVISGFARALRPGQAAIMVTKSADSYAELDDIAADSGLDPQARSRPSLYTAFHSANMEALAQPHLTVAQQLHERHLFRFDGYDHLAQYLTTTPRYRLPTADPAEIASRLRHWRPEHSVTASSTVSYLVGVRR
jgi:ubiquinone/menaquinone biosynthesis C-methylase UbiE